MADISLPVNGRRHELSIAPDTPLLWALRDHVGLTGTKFGCGIGECGICTVLLDDGPGYPPLGPAVLNALFDAAGVRVRALPLDRHFTG